MINWKEVDQMMYAGHIALKMSGFMLVLLAYLACRNVRNRFSTA